jgi:hypothetical protein
VCPASSNKTIALDLEDLHERLQESTEFESAICAINDSMETRLMRWPLRLRSLISPAKGPTVKRLIVAIVDYTWPEFAASIKFADKMKEEEAKGERQPPPLLEAVFPSEAVVDPDKTFGQDFEWLHELPTLDKCLDFYDWDLYISEPFAKPPSMDTIKIIDATPLGSSRRRIAKLASSHRPLGSVRQE